ncbi:hypothetical protein HPB50_012707 [Hyalomma asiaticum]|uniref:Uncharacterized protein n=1 Tax=Hyalomma asiaticum TaxID=266040 RepID=A0ACB7RU26_HYAAI|nr:hypothetical protein HPB50_012707 [Hyalomma asiaticum]
MDVTVEGHTITAEEFQAGHWTPVLYKAYASRPASLAKPLHSPIATSEANPDAKNAVRVAAAATGGGKTCWRLASLHNAASSCHHFHRTLFALSFAREAKYDLEKQFRPHSESLYLKTSAYAPPTNNTFTAATTHSPTAETLKTLTSLTIGGHTYQCVAYVAPPAGATRGVHLKRLRRRDPCAAVPRPGQAKSRQTKQPQTQQRELVPHGDNFPQLSRGPTQPTQHKRAWTVPLNKGLGPPPTSSKHASSLTTTSTLQGDLAKSREEAAAAKAEAQAARAEAAALREHIAKLEAQISTLATDLPAPPIPTPKASQPPPPNPPTAPVLPSHLNPDIYANSLETAQATQLTPACFIYGTLKQVSNDAGGGSVGTGLSDVTLPVSPKRLRSTRQLFHDRTANHSATN